MKVDLFQSFFVLFFCCVVSAFGQNADNSPTIELSTTNFFIERPFTISVTIPNSDTRPVLVFPTVDGFIKKGTSASVTTSEQGGKSVISQVITQTYSANKPGVFQLPPFELTINGFVARHEGATLTVRPSTTKPESVSVASNTALNRQATVGADEAFLSVRASAASVYAGEGFQLSISLLVAENYPFELLFNELETQLQRILKQLRPANAWEENAGIRELKPISVRVSGKAFNEYRIYQAMFFPLSARTIFLPAVSLTMLRSKPGLPGGSKASKPEPIPFVSRPLTVQVRPLPTRPTTEPVAVGRFKLIEHIERRRVAPGQSVRYEFVVEGEGNIATLPAPKQMSDSELDIFPPETRHTVAYASGKVTGRTVFQYFLIARKNNGLLPLLNHFQWVYFDPQLARYDTLRPAMRLAVSSDAAVTTVVETAHANQTGSIYAGIEKLDSTDQPLNVPVLKQAIANVLVACMIIGILIAFFKK